MNTHGKKGNHTPRRLRTGPGPVFLFLFAIVLTPLVLAWQPAPVSAEPYFAVRDGQKCSTCHVNHTGGGKRTAYGQVFMQTRMSMGFGTGAQNMEASEAPASGTDATPPFFHGYLNESVSIGADFRAAFIQRKDEGQDSTAHFNQPKTECAACHNGYDGKRADVYAQFEPVPGAVSLVFGQNLLPTAESREVYALLERMPMDTYVKVGTFRLPSGLNNTWDLPLVHGEVAPGDLIPGWSALRGQGVEVGMEPGPLAVSVSYTNPADLDAAPKAKRLGVSAYAVMDPVTFGAIYFNDPVNDEDKRVLTGYYAGLALGRFTLLAQRDLLKEPATDTTPEMEQMVLLGQLDFLLSQGQNLKLQYEAYDPDTAVDNNIRDRTSFIYEPFLTRYLQMRFGARVRNGPTEEAGANGRDVFIETHLMY